MTEETKDLIFSSNTDDAVLGIRLFIENNSMEQVMKYFPKSNDYYNIPVLTVPFREFRNIKRFVIKFSDSCYIYNDARGQLFMHPSANSLLGGNYDKATEEDVEEECKRYEVLYYNFSEKLVENGNV